MAQTIDDTESFSITLTDPCPEPELAFTVVSVSGMTVRVYVDKANPGAGSAWSSPNPVLSGEDDNAIENIREGQYYDYTFRTPGTHTLYLTGQNVCGNGTDARHTVTVSNAKGEIVNIDHPASVEHGARFEVRAAVKNTGGSTGHFYLMLYQNGHEDYEYELGDIAAGSTSSTVSLPATAPGTGSSTSIELKCIRTT